MVSITLLLLIFYISETAMEFYCNVFKQSSYTYRWEGTHSSADWVWSDIDAPLVFCKGIILVGNITSCTGC